ncbi:MAG TPA: DNA methyltransferase [Candidatus Lokiarchaeia archaeon]|nr:DNA methyltransferase [Candidatus Lokiarchaeia archaeon]
MHRTYTRVPKDETMVLKYPIAAAAHDAMHVQHKYWSRKPVNVVRAHIEAAATGPDDIILDAFCGSGTAVSQAVILGKKVVGIDINPVATFITRNTIARADVGDLLAIYERIKATIADPINALYRTRCPACLSIDTTMTVCVHWKVHHPIKIWYTCTNCSGEKKPKKLRKLPDAEDLLLLDKIKASEIPAWYPRKDIPPGMVFNQARRGAAEFADLFTKRNLFALALLRDEIARLPETTDEERVAKDLFLFSFTSMVHLCSRMTPIRPSRPYSSFWATNSYWLPRFFMESNVWEKFESAIIGPQGLIAARRDANAKVPPSTTIVSSFEDLARAPAPCAFIVAGDATRLDEIIPENSIDYIFTDPPYAGSIPYLELSTLWALWLNMGDQMPFDDEILVDPGRGKDLEQYKHKLEVFFEKAFLVLKEGKYLSFTYHNLDIKVRKAILGAAIEAGFVLDSIIYQPPPRTSPAHTLRPFNSAVGDYIVHLRKETRARSIQVITEGSTRMSKKEKASIEEEITGDLVQILLDRGEPATFTQIINDLDVRLAIKEWYFRSDVDPKVILKKNAGTRFITVKEKIGDKEGIKWWLEPAFMKKLLQSRGLTEIESLSRKIELFIQDHEQELAGLPLQGAQRMIFEQFNGIMLPDVKLIERLLKARKNKKI